MEQCVVWDGPWGPFHSWRNWGSEEGRASLEGYTRKLGPQTNSPEDPCIMCNGAVPSLWLENATWSGVHLGP